MLGFDNSFQHHAGNGFSRLEKALEFELGLYHMLEISLVALVVCHAGLRRPTTNAWMDCL